MRGLRHNTTEEDRNWNDMNSGTFAAHRALAAADPARTDHERQQLIEALNLSGDGRPREQLLRVSEVSRQLSVTRRTVGNYRIRGVLTPVVVPGTRRALGYRQSDITNFLAGLTLTKEIVA